jgi:hypothetical protein
MPEFFTNYAQPQQRQSLADLVNMASGIQQFQQQQQTLPLELRRLQAETKVAEETAQPRIQSAQAQAETARSSADVAQLERFQKFLSNSRRESASLIGQDKLTYDDIRKHYDDSLKNAIFDPRVREQALNQAMAQIPKGGSTAQYREILARDLTKTMSAESQVDKLFPAISMQSTGAQTVPVTTGSALAMQAPGRIAGPGIETEIPPTQQIIEPTGATRLVGPLSQRGLQNLQTGVGPVQAGILGASGENIAKDWTNTSFEAAGAPGRIAVFQNIKRLVPESFTGVGAERKQFVSGLAQAIGIPANILETSSTDELSKNTKLLQLAGGNTDAARGIAELANPNTKMTKEGILRVTNQLISIERMKEKKAQFLQPYTNNGPEYQRRMQEFNQVADPRIFQDIPDAETKKQFDAMTKRERDELIGKIRQARQLGIL